MKSNNLIKQPPVGTRTPPARRPVVKRSVLEAEREAARIIAGANHEAALIRADAEREARELHERTDRETREICLAEWMGNLVAARETRDTALAEVERDALRLAVRIAEKIIGRELEQRPDTIADIAAAAIRHARQHEMLTVRINPADVPRVQENRARLDATGRARLLDIVSDQRVRPGGCIIESESGTVDAELETQLRVIERALLARTTTR